MGLKNRDSHSLVNYNQGDTSWQDFQKQKRDGSEKRYADVANRATHGPQQNVVSAVILFLDRKRQKER